MELKQFLLLIAVFMLVVLLIATIRGEKDKWTNSPIGYFLILALTVFLSYFTFMHYAKSDGKSGYYKNTDYHIFQQEGFRYLKGQIAKLGCDNADSAVLISGAGNLSLDESLRLSTDHFELPLYVGDGVVNKHSKDTTVNLKVVNIIKEYAMSNGDSLSIKKNGEPLLTIRFIEFPHKNRFIDCLKKNSKIPDYDSIMFVFSVNGGICDSVVKRSIHKGYNLADLLQEGGTTRLNGDMISLLGSCYLIRDHYTLDAPKINRSDKLYLFADNSLFNDSCKVAVNGNEKINRVDNKVSNLEMNNRYFCYGLGNATSQVYQVKSDENSVFVKYRLPLMYHLPNDMIGERKMYLTTCKQDIIDLSGSYDLFYQFNEQLSENSLYESSAVMDFRIDKAGASLNPEYIYTFNHNNPCEPISIIPGQSFEVKSKSCDLDDSKIAQISYVFNIKDMRRNEVYNGAKSMYVWILILLIIVYLILHYLPKQDGNSMNKWYGIETSVYLVMIAFLTVRLVLLWRLHTFPPIEGVSYKEFGTLTDVSYYNWTLGIIVAILVIRICVLVIQWLVYNGRITPPNWMDLRQGMADVFEWASDSFWRKCILFVVPFLIYLLLGFLLGRSRMLEVFIKEALAPIIAFVINSVYFTYKVEAESHGDDHDENVQHTRHFCWFGIILNSISFLGVLLMPKSWIVGMGEQGMFAPMAAMLALWMCIAVFLTENRGTVRRWALFVVAILGFIIVFLHAGIIGKTDMGKKLISQLPFSRIKARMETLVYTPTEMVQAETVEFGGGDLQDILNASSNKWFIDNHLIQRKKLDLHDGDFRLDKDYNQLAVSYSTQTRDVVLLRYIIYEHGKGIVAWLLVILALLATSVFLLYKREGCDLPMLQMVPLQSVLFLIVFAGFLYLVNLNAVVFVGLDFPFLTMASKVAPLGLLLPLFAVLFPLNVRNTEDCLEEELTTNERDRNKYIVFGCAIVCVVFFMWKPGRWEKQRMDKRVKDGKLYAESFSISMEPLAVFINNYLNPEFKDWQDKEEEIVERENAKQRTGKKKAAKLKSFKSMPVASDSIKMKFEKVLMREMLDKELKAYARDFNDQSHSGDALFIKSAFKKFLNTTLTNPKNIIHIRKIKGRFVFVPNKLYYDMKPMFNDGDKVDWNGNLLAAKSSRSLYFIDKSELQKQDASWAIDSVSRLKKYGLEDKYKKFLVSDESLLGWIYQIPAKYCYQSNDDVFVMMADVQKDKTIHVYPKCDYSTASCIKEGFGLRFFANDIVEMNGEASRFSLSLSDDHYFSKRIHYNGKHQALYPLGNQFMFAYNFDQMLAESYHPHDSLSKQPVRISLDYCLLDSVNKYCEKVMRHDNGYGDGITVTAVDGYGRIRLLADYNPNKVHSTDPNQEKELRGKMDEIYLNGDEDAERGLLENRNVFHLHERGPGSTIKVPFYVALMTETEKMQWDTMRMHFPRSIYQKVYTGKGVERDMVSRFGKDEVMGFHTLKDSNGNPIHGWDEMATEYSNPAALGMLGPSDFIATSNNFYFSTLLMLGAYDAQELNERLGSVLDVSSQDENVFPKIVFKDHYYTFKKHLMGDIQNGPSMNSHALEDGLQNWFRFNVARKKETIKYYDREPVERLFDPTIEAEWFNLNGQYVHSTKPSLYRDIDAQIKENEFYNNHFQLTSGSPLQLDVSPLNMAEMYLRVALLNGSEKNLLTYNDEAKGVPLTKDLPYSGFDNLMQKTVFKGMFKVIEQRKAGANGTLSNISTTNEAKQRVGEELKKELKKKGIVLYGKTGTAGDEKGNNYHYAFILANQPLHKDNIDRSNLKVYVVYFGYYNGSKGHYGTRVSRDEILHQIINSETFKEYWNSSEPQEQTINQ